MSKILTVPRENRCIGCGLCVLQASLVKDSKLSVSDSYIRVTGKAGKYKVVIDYGNDTSDPSVLKICPRNCFDIVENNL